MTQRTKTLVKGESGWWAVQRKQGLNAWIQDSDLRGLFNFPADTVEIDLVVDEQTPAGEEFWRYWGGSKVGLWQVAVFSPIPVEIHANCHIVTGGMADWLEKQRLNGRRYIWLEYVGSAV